MQRKIKVIMTIAMLFAWQVVNSQTINREGVSVIVPENSTAEQVENLAVQVRPSYRQVDYQEREMIGFIHIGMNTFTGNEWGTGREDNSLFNPKDLDADKWVRTFKEAGITAVILVAKHHDGFCVWPSKYTEHSVANSPWRNGKGDLVREVADACKKYDMKLCIYLSPWDMHESTYGTDAYNDFYINTMSELLQSYGPIYLLWLDGAGLDTKNTTAMKFDWDRIFSRARELQPDIILSGNGPDIRWVGNEKGKGRSTEWSVQGINELKQFWGKPDGYSHTKANLGSIDDLKTTKRLVWYPSRGGLPLRKGWFYNANDNNTTKSLSYLVNSYFSTVGQNSNLLPNLSPDETGRIPEKDAKRLIEFGKIIKQMKSVDYAKGAKYTFSKECLFDKNKNELPIHTADGVRKATLEINLSKPSKINVIKLQENIVEYGQRVDSFAIDIKENGKWVNVANGTTIGAKRMLRLDKPVETSALRVRILHSRVSVSISNISLYLLPEIASDNKLENNKIKRIPDNGISLSKSIKITGNTDLQNEDLKKYSNLVVSKFPTYITYKIEQKDKITGLKYIPWPQENANHIQSYSVSVSKDGKKWETIKSNSIFGNIVNNPVEQYIPLTNLSGANYIRFEIKSLIDNNKPVKLIGLFLTN